jgi:hypothetical protein
MTWSRKIFVTLLIFGLGMVSGFVLSDAADNFTRILLPLIGAMASLWLFDVFLEGALRSRNRRQEGPSRRK